MQLLVDFAVQQDQLAIIFHDSDSRCLSLLFVGRRSSEEPLSHRSQRPPRSGDRRYGSHGRSRRWLDRDGNTAHDLNPAFIYGNAGFISSTVAHPWICASFRVLTDGPATGFPVGGGPLGLQIP